MSLYAAVDIGTNSCRLLIAEMKNGELRPLYRDLKTTRLGEDLMRTGAIKNDALERTAAALSDFVKVIKGYGASKVGAAATSAAREASNADFFLSAVKEKAGLNVEVISAAEEARLSYLGAVNSINFVKAKPVVVDIGGGSTEIIYYKDRELKDASIDVGAVRCTEKKSKPTQIIKELQPVLDDVNSLEDDIKLIGVGGTVTTLAAVHKELEVFDPEKIHNSVLSRDVVEKLFFDLFEMSWEERKRVPGLQPERADIIPAGALILLLILTYLDVDSIIVSEADILYGMIRKLHGENNGGQ